MNKFLKRVSGFFSNKTKVSKFLVILVIAISAIVITVPFVVDIAAAITDKKASDNAESSAYSIYIDDQANLFGEFEENDIKKAAGKVARYTNVLVHTTDNTSGLASSFYAEDLFSDTFSDKGVLFIIDMDNRELRIQTDNNNKKLTVAKCNTITDNAYRYASKEEYAKCTIEALEQIARTMGGYAVPQPMKHINNLLLASVISLLFVFYIAKDMTKHQNPDEIYQIGAKTSRHLDLTMKNVRTMAREKVDRYPDTGSSSGGFSGGSSGGGGGGHSGGGGGGSHGGGHGF